ncbi:zinc-finger homeodomain protein 9-like [Andrographis paniculata]|uniref:zinc-finger homeodomain protein 9-like n=1 Tax=Andrographis paniculata TaxID=175694 RepID=UPI0021E7C329|nr:zinc-finger homeodomain protein 9-like [Andrographis paniculata]
MDATAAGNSTVKTPEAESETPTRIQPSFGNANGVLKRHAPQHLHPPVVVTYRDCLKNHAASIGGHAVDGCGEFMPSPGSDPADPTSLKCAACGCHRNFHRREPDEAALAAAMEFRSLHRHQPPQPPARRGDSGSSPNNSPSPPPISSSFYPSASHMLLALSHGASAPHPESNPPISPAINAASAPRFKSNSRKRFRTKFTQNQKDKMLELAEKVDWKMQKKDEDLINESCAEIGVERGVFKVWMHNNKNTLGKKDNHHPPAGNGANHSVAAAGDSSQYPRDGTNGSSSSS